MRDPRRRIAIAAILSFIALGAGALDKPRNHLDDSNRLIRAIESADGKLFEYYRCNENKNSSGCEIFRVNFIQFHDQELTGVRACLDCHRSLPPSKNKLPNPLNPRSFLADLHRASEDCFFCHSAEDLSAEKVNPDGNDTFQVKKEAPGS